MRICIVGAGAIGGYVGAKLAQAGAELTLIARGAHLEAILRDGLTVEYADGERDVVRPALATADMAAAGTHDYVIVAVKAQYNACVALADILLAPKLMISRIPSGASMTTKARPPVNRVPAASMNTARLARS